MVGSLIVTQAGDVVGVVGYDTTMLATLVSLLVPMLVSVVTKQNASDGLRAIVNIVAVAVVAVCALWINPSGDPVTMPVVVNTILASLVSSFVAYKSFFKPTGLTGTLTRKTRNFGLGPQPVLETPDKGAEELNETNGVDK